MSNRIWAKKYVILLIWESWTRNLKLLGLSLLMAKIRKTSLLYHWVATLVHWGNKCKSYFDWIFYMIRESGERISEYRESKVRWGCNGSGGYKVNSHKRKVTERRDTIPLAIGWFGLLDLLIINWKPLLCYLANT